MSQLSYYFKQQQFCILVEYLSAAQPDHAVRQQFAGFPALMTLADRVQTDEDRSPLAASQLYPKQVEKVLHYAGKGRDIEDFEDFLVQAQAANIQNLLLLTGDKLKGHQNGQGNEKRTRYLESVNAVMAAKKFGGFQIGVAFNPFKYAQAERDAQYFKLYKKLKAGADFIITQLGYDMQALKQAQTFLAKHHYAQKIMACVMPLNLARAQFMLKHQVAGIVITSHMLTVLKQEKYAGQSQNMYARCALQILMCKALGFAGVHLSACHQPHEQQLLEDYIQQYRHLNLLELQQQWAVLWQLKTGDEFIPHSPSFSRQPVSSQIIQYQQLHFIHAAVFESHLCKKLGKWIFSSNIWDKKFASKLLIQTEHISKHAAVGCESCGQCRLAETLYICPETCPKGLANGPCGGTQLDRCEFGDRECIHSIKARLAQAVDQTAVLKQALIPTIPVDVRGTSSWKNWYLSN